MAELSSRCRCGCIVLKRLALARPRRFEGFFRNTEENATFHACNRHERVEYLQPWRQYEQTWYQLSDVSDI
jgi:hypothetical protein